MAGYISLVLNNRKAIYVSLVQLVLVSLMAVIFVIGVPWATSDPITSYPVSGYEKPPEWANYYGINHGEPYFYKTSRIENPIRFKVFLGFFLLLYAVLLLSAYYMYKLSNKKSSKLKRKS